MYCHVAQIQREKPESGTLRYSNHEEVPFSSLPLCEKTLKALEEEEFLEKM